MDWMDKLLYPLQWVVAWILAIFHEIFTAIGLPSRQRLDLGALDRRTDRGHPCSPHPSLRLPDQVAAQDAAAAAGDPASAGEVQRQEGPVLASGHGRRADGAVPRQQDEPVGIVSAAARADADLLLALPRHPQHAEGRFSGDVGAIGGFTQQLAIQAENSSIFGISLSADLHASPGDSQVKLLTGVLIVIMAATMFITQKQMMAKNMSESAMANPMMQSQKMLLYVMPLVFGIGGIYFPLGVLIYWLVSNTWTMAQQHMVIRNMPAPGSKAEKEMLERKARKGKTVKQDELKGDRPSPRRPRRRAASGSSL
jgi:YidC/Oxa1 family membrane protein insertase